MSDAAEGPSRTLTTVAAANVTPRAVAWLWEGRVPSGKVTLAEGQPGLGKTLAVLDLAARVSTGRPMPLSSAGSGQGRAVLVVSYEDDPADTLRPRLEAAGADLERCHIVIGVRDATTGDNEPALLPVDLDLLGAEIGRTGAAMVIIDPLMAALASGVDAHRDQDVRRVLSRVRLMAESTGAAIVLVRHLRKAATPGQAITAGQGSIGIVGAARAAHLVARDPVDEERRIFAPVKSNIGRLPKAVTYRVADRHISAGIVAPVVEWLGECDATADDLTGVASIDEEMGAALKDAVAWLRGELSTGGRRVTELKTAAQSAGIAWRTVERAKNQLGVKAGKLAYKDGWGWSMPAEVCQHERAGGLAEDRHEARQGSAAAGPRRDS